MRCEPPRKSPPGCPILTSPGAPPFPRSVREGGDFLNRNVTADSPSPSISPSQPATLPPRSKIEPNRAERNPPPCDALAGCLRIAPQFVPTRPSIARCARPYESTRVIPATLRTHASASAASIPCLPPSESLLSQTTCIRSRRHPVSPVRATHDLPATPTAPGSRSALIRSPPHRQPALQQTAPRSAPPARPALSPRTVAPRPYPAESDSTGKATDPPPQPPPAHPRADAPTAPAVPTDPPAQHHASSQLTINLHCCHPDRATREANERNGGPWESKVRCGAFLCALRGCSPRPLRLKRLFPTG